MKYNKTKLLSILKQYKIEPKTLAVYIEALTHKSYANEINSKTNYERLEFLGDATIHFILTKYIYSYNCGDDKNKIYLNESEMTRLRANLEESKTLAKATVQVGLNEVLLLGNGLKGDNFIKKDKVYEDVFEAFVGAILIDQGHKKAEYFISQTLIKMLHNNEVSSQKDPKTQFQEFMQTNSSVNDIKYLLIKQEDSLFTVNLMCNDLLYGIGVAQTRKEAEIKAAQDALDKIKLEIIN